MLSEPWAAVQLSVGVAPAVRTAAVLSPAVPAAAAAVRPPARVSIVEASVSLTTMVSRDLVAVAVETAASLVVVAASSPVAPAAARAVAAPHAATAASPLLPVFAPGGPVVGSLVLTAFFPSAFHIRSAIRA